MGGAVVLEELLCGRSCCVGEAVEHTLITYKTPGKSWEGTVFLGFLFPLHTAITHVITVLD